MYGAARARCFGRQIGASSLASFGEAESRRAERVPRPAIATSGTGWCAHARPWLQRAQRTVRPAAPSEALDRGGRLEQFGQTICMGPTIFGCKVDQPSVNGSEPWQPPQTWQGIANFRPVGRHNPGKKKCSSGTSVRAGDGFCTRRGRRPGSDLAALSSILGRGGGGGRLRTWACAMSGYRRFCVTSRSVSIDFLSVLRVFLALADRCCGFCFVDEADAGLYYPVRP